MIGALFENILSTNLLCMFTESFSHISVAKHEEETPVTHKKYRITFGTVCMNRLHHIKLTLPKNIEDNADYEEADFVLLDYNSTDGLEEWVKENCGQYLQTGKLKYYKTTEPSYFNRSHSRNMSFRFSEGEIICNVDADNYTGKGFAAYINEEFNNRKDFFLAGSYNDEYAEYKDSFGRFCAWRKDFFEVGGYDEEMESYGHEDTDLYERLARSGKKEINILNKTFLHSISHGDSERTGNEFFVKHLDRFYLAYLENKSRVLFLYNNGTFETGTLVPNYYSLPAPSSIEEGNWIKGSWEESGTALKLSYDKEGEDILFTDNGSKNYISLKNNVRLIYTHIVNRTFVYNTMLSYSIITNSNRVHINENSKKVKVNESLVCIGRGEVFKNFENQHLIK